MLSTIETDSFVSSNRKSRIGLWVRIGVLVVGGWLLVNYGARSEFLLGLFARNPILMPSSIIARNLDDETGSLVHSSLYVLGQRKYEGAQEKAHGLLRSHDNYTWFNAALYLGALRDPMAVPYLIKGLRHPAWRSHEEAVFDLQAITGQTIGNDFNAWQQWYVNKHANHQFDFEIR